MHLTYNADGRPLTISGPRAGTTYTYDPQTGLSITLPTIAALVAGLALPASALGTGASHAARVSSDPIPSRGAQPQSIALGPDGNLWFTEENASKVARITPRGRFGDRWLVVNALYQVLVEH